MDLQLSTRAVGERALVEVIGEVDLDTAPQLGTQALAALRDISPHLIIDLSQVAFMDSTGLKVLLSSQRAAALASGSFALVGATRTVRRILELTSLEQVLHLYGSLEEVPPVPMRVAAVDVLTQGTATHTPADALTDGAAPTP